ncbi:helix-turn-helix domain-containing protein [Proteus mirabilis]|nr:MULTISPECIES: helix-turn-helix domain-containing protein [Proteus]AZH05957.1 helix-turn-helix domain-containing protein [Proteus mirabilis]EJD6087603.1 helix-turn-helix domain-containing protein [Proteus mirabilis]EKW1743698.1 helix-turn-helix domain-containing protein [Proteus mirabilis]EKX9133844.1 helix-turn-helix domain-containing protein [Proteus mirabilis]MBG2849175.1 helix-turn-helix domain-containing protein [Proteus mirabilis]
MSQYEDGFPQRLLSERSRQNLTQQELANMVGISQRQIAAYEAGESKPRIGTLMKLANALDVSFVWLASHSIDIGDVRVISMKDKPADKSMTVIPLIDIDNVIPWIKNELYREGAHEYVSISGDVRYGSFAITQKDAAMSYTSREGISFPIGSIVVFDPSRTPVKDGDFVLAIINHKSSVFRQVFIGSSECNLIPLDNRYPVESISTESIVACKNLLIPATQVIYNLPAMKRNIDSEITP